MSEKSKTSWAVKRVIARLAGISPTQVLHAHDLVTQYGYSTSGKLGLAAQLNAEFVAMNEPFDQPIHPTETSAATTVGDLVEIVRAHRRQGG